MVEIDIEELLKLLSSLNLELLGFERRQDNFNIERWSLDLIPRSDFNISLIELLCKLSDSDAIPSNMHIEDAQEDIDTNVSLVKVKAGDSKNTAQYGSMCSYITVNFIVADDDRPKDFIRGY